MSSILMIKDQKTNEWIEVTSLIGPRGKDGTDYILTDADKEEIAALVNAGADLSDYYTKKEVEALIPSINGLATVSYVDEKFNSVEVDVDLSNYYTKSEVNNLIPTIPDHSQYALKSDIPDHSQYAVKADIPDVSQYQTAEQVAAAITDALDAIGVAEEGEY